MTILLEDFNVKVDSEDIFKPTIGNETLREISNDNGVRVVKFGRSKNLTVKVQCSNIATCINIFVRLQTGKPKIKWIIFC
jgi:hypothetical protein